jgi:CRISPR-associated endoribonuclease Cas6
MRIYLHLTPNTETVPFNYQPALVGAFHQWLGENDLHDEISLYSLSWLHDGRMTAKGLDFPDGSIFQISAPKPELLANLINGIQEYYEIRWGMKVDSIVIKRTPDFGPRRRFLVQSPVLVQRRDAEGKQQYYFPGDEKVNDYLTETLRHKLRRAGLSEEVEVAFDPDYRNVRKKLVNYKGVKIKAATCPVIISGAPEAVAFAWDVGVGNSTGIGFGALR